ncbi:sigma-70 family RNA polymerase sigma factor [Actinoplanes sp. TRM 88003]|uniref:Sigma-70 family RNA polymerase sigma factor n=1 Tax=Paractinoplanes aksuensis TaxID=2939490 RepID=A0ABT1DFS1_9ACTN|nr:sigma-70 family RNA polymerase sigma factor [Actinoplanes aksuensis]MCO8269673.1 sigma-70 family RNA polymerase sigma factor [Actinoplanes aksuensis]
MIALLRDLAPQVVAVLTHRFGDFESAEDAVQEALLAAATRWPVDGTPENPRGWLIQTAQRKLLDQLRGDQARRRREVLTAMREPTGPAVERDDTLDVLFLCCHPALSDTSAVALTLRAVGGLSTGEIARAFLVPEKTMGQRISRAKQQIRAAGSSFGGEPRLGAALRVLYLIFNEGYTAVHRVELAAEAIRLTRMVHERLPEDGEVAGLLALMLLTDARRPARTAAGGDLVPLAEQDRTLWDADRIKEGTAIVDAAFRRGRVGEYQLQAAVAALHDRATSVEQTDWPQIAALYGVLEKVTQSPVVTLNRAIAVAMIDGPAAGLALVDTLDLPGHRVAATRGHLLELAGDPAGAVAQYRLAAAATAGEPEKRYLTIRAATLTLTLGEGRG